MTGGVGLPQVTWQPNSRGRARRSPRPARDAEKPSVSTVTDTYAQQDGPDTGPPFPGRNPPVWHKFMNLCQAGDDLLFDNPLGDNLPDSGQTARASNFGSGGFLSNMDNAYVYDRDQPRLRQDASCSTAKAPTFAATYPSAPRMPTGEQLRYWSFCQNDPFNQRYIGCLRDDQVKLDKDGFFTIVDQPAVRPAEVREELDPVGTAARGRDDLPPHAARARRSARRSSALLTGPSRDDGRLLPDAPLLDGLVSALPLGRLLPRLQRLGQRLVEVVDEHEVDLLAQVLGDVVDVGLVQLRRDDALDPGPLSRQRLLLQAADRQHLADERDLAGHRRVRSAPAGR